MPHQTARNVTGFQVKYGYGDLSSQYSAVLSINISTNVKRGFVNIGKFGNVSINSFLQLILHLWEKGVGCSGVER
jgi:hypothetical protein